MTKKKLSLTTIECKNLSNVGVRHGRQFLSVLGVVYWNGSRFDTGLYRVLPLYVICIIYLNAIYLLSFCSRKRKATICISGPSGLIINHSCMYTATWID